jgi:hypothetical protein
MRNATLAKTLSHRRKAIGQWLEKNAPETFEDQSHLDEGSAERAYWTHGYQAALSDVIEFIASQASNNAGTSSH